MKKSVFFIFVVFCLLSSVCRPLKAGTFRVIVACNTGDDRIGNSCSMDMRHINQLLSDLSRAANIRYEIKTFSGSTCTRDAVSEYISNLPVDSDDVVLFYYSGHGTHAVNNQEDPFPQMCMNTNVQSLFYPVSNLKRQIAAKQPRLMLIFTDCCNKEQEGVSVKPFFDILLEGKQYDVDAIRKLLFGYSGSVTMTSSKLGQYSFCDIRRGGYFTNRFVDAMNAVSQGYLDPDWSLICKKIRDRVSAIEYRDGMKQEPYYEINISSK